jgi:hypothetical protein
MRNKVLIWLMIAVSVSWFLLGAATEMFYYSELPKHSDQDRGQTVQVTVNHGSVRFGSANQARWLGLVRDGLPIAGLLFAATLFCGLKLGVLRVRGSTARPAPLRDIRAEGKEDT